MLKHRVLSDFDQLAHRTSPSSSRRSPCVPDSHRSRQRKAIFPFEDLGNDAQNGHRIATLCPDAS